MIVVTGASGQLGKRIVEELLKRKPGSELGISVRDPEKAQEFARRGVRVRKGDFGDAASLRQSFEGASQVLLVSSNAAAFGQDPVAQHRTAIEAAKQSGVRRIVYTSQISASPTSAFNPGLDHHQTEVLLKESGLKFTALRNGFYATRALEVMAGAIKAGELVAPQNGKFSWTSHADLAEVAAVIACNEGRFEGATPPLTGSEAIDFEQLADLASKASGRTIRKIAVSDEQYVENLKKGGMPAHVTRIVLGMFVAARKGEFATVDPTLEQLIGHRPISLSQLLTEKLAS